MNKTVTICDECGVEKKETNHWYLVLDDFGKDKNLSLLGCPGIAIVPWNDGLAKSLGLKHICGQNCATAIFSRWLSYGQLESVVAAERKETS